MLIFSAYLIRLQENFLKIFYGRFQLRPAPGSDHPSLLAVANPPGPHARQARRKADRRGQTTPAAPLPPHRLSDRFHTLPRPPASSFSPRGKGHSTLNRIRRLPDRFLKAPPHFYPLTLLKINLNISCRFCRYQTNLADNFNNHRKPGFFSPDPHQL